jgi:TolB-like protein
LSVRRTIAICIWLGVFGTLCAAAPGEGEKTFIVVFDFAGEEDYGAALAESVRLRLRRHEDCEVVDRLTTREFSGPLGAKEPEKIVRERMGQLACGVALYGTVHKSGSNIRVEARCLLASDAGGGRGWEKVLSDAGERSRAVISRGIVETLREEGEWTPPEYGDEPEPGLDELGRALNAGGGFEPGSPGWDAPDNVSTFLVPGPPGRGGVLRVRTDLARGPWLAYQRDLLLGRADRTKPPAIARDTGYHSVAGLEGVHFRSDWIDAQAGQRYWLMADCKGPTQGIFFPKVFVKGFLDWTDRADGLPERSLVERKLTPEAFAALAKAEQKRLIADDARAHPERYRRECYRWYLACRCGEGWKHFAAPFPPRGGLPANVRWLRIEIYSYWPPGEYLWDNVHLYRDPAQKEPVAEEAPRTPGAENR